MIKYSPAVLLLLYMTAAMVGVVVAELQRFDHAVKSDGSLSFLVVGDWGRRGLYNQSNVAYQVSLLLIHIYIPINCLPSYILAS